jgi:hypothetical protein
MKKQKKILVGKPKRKRSLEKPEIIGLVLN